MTTEAIDGPVWHPLQKAVAATITAYREINGGSVDDAHMALVRQLAFGKIVARGMGIIHDFRPAATKHEDTVMNAGSDVPAEFWNNWASANERTCDWLTGEFAFLVLTGEEPSACISGRAIVTDLSGAALDAIICSMPVATQTQAPKRKAGTYKGGDPDRDTAIIAMVDELKRPGQSGRAAVDEMRKLPGFEDVDVHHGRSLIKGRYTQGNGAKK
jgi:hypothetical protein